MPTPDDVQHDAQDFSFGGIVATPCNDMTEDEVPELVTEAVHHLTGDDLHRLAGHAPEPTKNAFDSTLTVDVDACNTQKHRQALDTAAL
jgi:hypothetical protein